MFQSEIRIAYLQYLVDTLYGASMMFLLSGVPRTGKNVRSMAAVAFLSYAAVAFAVSTHGLAGMGVIYSLFVHLPFILYIAAAFKRPLSAVFLSNLLVYFSLSPRLILANLSIAAARSLGWEVDGMAAARFGYAATGPLVIWPMYRWLVQPFRGLVDQPRPERIMLLAVGGSSYLVIQLLSIASMTTRRFHPMLTSTLFVLFLLAFIISLAMYSSELRKSGEARAMIAAYANQAEGMRLYADALRGFIDETKRLRHDQRHFFTLVGMRAAAGDLEGIRRLAGSRLEALDQNAISEAGSDVVDGLLALYRKRAGEYGVSIRVDGAGLRDLPLPEDDLCLFLSNCLENAVNAARSVEGRKRVVRLSVSMDAKGRAIGLEARNPYSEPVMFDADGTPISSKGPGHGYGTRSMRSVVKKHRGVCSFSTEGGDFVFRAAFIPERATTTVS